MLTPLAIINHFKPTRTLPGDKQLHELYPLGTEHSDLRLPRSERFWTWGNFFLRVDNVLKVLHPLRFRPMRQRALEEAERWMLERIDEARKMIPVLVGGYQQIQAATGRGGNMLHDFRNAGSFGRRHLADDYAAVNQHVERIARALAKREQEAIP